MYLLLSMYTTLRLDEMSSSRLACSRDSILYCKSNFPKFSIIIDLVSFEPIIIGPKFMSCIGVTLNLHKHAKM